MKKLLEFGLAALLIAGLTGKAHGATRHLTHRPHRAATSEIIQPVRLDKHGHFSDAMLAASTRNGLSYASCNGIEQDGFGSLTVSGLVANLAGHSFRYVEIDFRILDAEGAQIGVATANTQYLDKGGVWSFSAIALGCTGRASKCECVRMFGLR